MNRTLTIECTKCKQHMSVMSFSRRDVDVKKCRAKKGRTPRCDSCRGLGASAHKRGAWSHVGIPYAAALDSWKNEPDTTPPWEENTYRRNKVPLEGFVFPDVGKVILANVKSDYANTEWWSLAHGGGAYGPFEEHCQSLADGGHTPWYGGGDSKGRVFVDRGRVSWYEIIERVRVLRLDISVPDRMVQRRENRHADEMLDRMIARGPVPHFEHGFFQ